jgi:2'-5' RNA ligase
MRLFVSVDLDDLAGGIADAQRRLPDAESLRFVEPADAHVTLKFLGEIPPDRRDEVDRALAAAVDEAGVDPFDLAIGGYGVFPSREYISVVWAGVRQGGSALTRLHEACERELIAVGFEPADHAFTPHVTLARMRDARGKAAVQRVVDEQDPAVGRTRVAEIRLTESTLEDEGPRYRTVSRFPL